ncbi:MAG: NADH-quinone oxidoreductase subunit C [Candidatus Cloacimonetes bacterium]|nr:NADH-quinone oxidoreductase subunit C [Candidatus Cloacimonadota bacterium]
MLEIINRTKEKFRLTDLKKQRSDLVFFAVPRKEAVKIITYLRDLENFTHLVLITAVDYPELNRFQLTYLLHNYNNAVSIGIKIMIPRNKAEMDSIHHLWAQAATYQRELREMFGINFPGSPGIEENFALEGWDDIPPMRRDFDTKAYSEKTFFPREGRISYDPREYMKVKLYPEDKEE